MPFKKMMFILFAFIIFQSFTNMETGYANSPVDNESNNSNEEIVEELLEENSDEETSEITEPAENENKEHEDEPSEPEMPVEDGDEELEEQPTEAEGDSADNEVDEESSVEENTDDSENDQSGNEMEGDEEDETPAKNSDFEFGDRHERIIELKEGLNQIGFGTILVTEYFGNFTETKVRAFQDYYDLPVTGIADEATFEKLESVFDHSYQKGKSHANLADLKVKLNWMGYGHILVTENFGSWMESRVKAFQRDHGLAVSGIIEPITETNMNETFANIFKVNNRHASIVDLKELLNQTSFGGILVSDLYGSYTSTRVRQFQEHYELEATGEANLETIKMLEDVLDTPFRVGNRHPDTIELKEGLNRLGFGPILVSDLYGSFTKHQVTAFQEAYGLQLTGIANDATWTKLNELLDSPLQKGRSHGDLIDLKQMLNWTGYGHILVTENYGSWMESRVRSFQQDHDLPVNGIIDEKTQLAIESTFEQGFAEGNRNPGVIQMKEGLNKLGFGNILVSNLYGSFTAQQVRSFQKYYGLEAVGQADLATLNKINELLDTPFQPGKRHDDLLNIKDQMNDIGFGYITVTTLFGSYTEQKVKELQEYYGLRVNGILDEPTKTKIEEVFNSPFRVGKHHEDTIDIKNKLNSLGFGKIIVSDYYGEFTEQQLKKFQASYGLVVNGIADEPTMDLLNQLSSLSEFELEVVLLTNIEREKEGLSSLLIDQHVSNVAREKSNDMIVNGYFNHESPQYGTPFDMLTEFGVPYRYAGENIAAGHSSPSRVVTAWMESPGHRFNIMNSSFTHIGVGYDVGGEYTHYWTQMFIGR
ncbi:peptidoglycan-binding protein [Salipaludibacillus sp. HK11]|uniref:peptidoglycan-binding protein n=1 Tax=Salipaludibacillus sp. HK11 TaxID=3394320 RepID=UPI0039FD2EB7